MKTIKGAFKISWFITSITAVTLIASNLLAQDAFAQDPQEVPWQTLPTPTVVTNGATFLRDFSKNPTPPGPGGPAPIPDSPGTTLDFQGLTDNNIAYPPDTCGAVGTNYVVTMLNTQVRFQTRTGATVRTVTLPQFWTGTNIGSYSVVFDPRIGYDPFNHRWIACASFDYYSSTAGILIGISRTSNPTNTGDAGWILRRTKADPASQRWGDFPMLGFNKDWIVVSANMFFTSGPFDRQNFYVYSKTNLYAGGNASPTILTDTNYPGNEFPAVTTPQTVGEGTRPKSGGGLGGR